jgi:hypothetical protein
MKMNKNELDGVFGVGVDWANFLIFCIMFLRGSGIKKRLL